MKSLVRASVVAMLLAGHAPRSVALGTSSARNDAAAESLGWHLGVQAWTFRDRTAFEAIDAAAKLGLKSIELYPGQALSPDQHGVKIGVDMTIDELAALSAKLDTDGVRAASFGVVDIKNDEPATRKLFDFARKLGVDTITCDPDPDACDLLDKLCFEYKIGAAIHNHPKPARYASPEQVLDVILHHTRMLQACADTGHWQRSGLVPLECLKKLEGHVAELHFKDVANGADVPWGTGQSDAAGLLRELRRQGFQGLVAIEYENGAGAELEANVARCIRFFDDTARALTAVRLVIDPALVVERNWYQDAYLRAEGDKVQCDASPASDGALVLRIASAEGRKTAGIRLEIHLSNAAPKVSVVSRWWTDVRTPGLAPNGTAPFAGGEITLSAADVHARPLFVRFELATRFRDTAKTVSGGIRIDH